MATDTKVDNQSCLIPTFERNRYFFGKPMTVRDFEAEQQYLMGKSRMQHRLIHGVGILCGMRLTNPKLTDGKFTVDISEGAALDCCGNLIAVNRSDTVEVLAESTVTDGTYYIYVRYAECVRQPIMAAANASSCEEVCCYNRIREMFELFITSEAPGATNASFTGAVKTAGAKGIIGASVKALKNGIVQAETLCDADGNFQMGVNASGSPDTFDLQAGATGFALQKRAGISISAGPPLAIPDFVLNVQDGPAPAAVCNEISQTYFDTHLATCLRCDNPKVFLAVARINGTTVTLDPDPAETRRRRSVIHSNQMLHDLSCDHFADFNNPHRTSAEQIRALQSLNNVGNVAGRDYVKNISLVSKDATIGVAPDPDHDNQKIDLSLAPLSVKRSHLHNDTINGLLTSDDTITIQPNTAARNINIKTNRAASVSSVATAQVVGTSVRFAPEDHVHDLANGVVSKVKLGNDVINTLLSSDQTITVTPDLGARQIALKTNPATVVTSVGPAKVIGTSPRYSPEDHVHDLHINGRAPDANGAFKLTSGGIIKIDSGAPNELIISAQAGQTFNVPSGRVRFEQVEPRELRASPQINHQLEAKSFAIVLGLENSDGFITVGDLTSDGGELPALLASYSPGAKTFSIELRDIRSTEARIPVTYLVRWWAIPSTVETETVVSLPQG